MITNVYDGRDGQIMSKFISPKHSAVVALAIMVSFYPQKSVIMHSDYTTVIFRASQNI